MDIVVRSPHGVADVAVADDGRTATVGDVVRLVTGQAVPPVAVLDGRVIDTGTRLADAGLRVGSLVDTTTVEHGTPPAVAALLQLAGRGAGAVRALGPGRYRIGPGRRIHAPEMEPAPVEITALELTVGDDGGVEVRPGYSGPVLINGHGITEATPWQGGMLTVGERVFALESPAAEPERRTLPGPDPRGRIAFSRPPPVGDAGPRLLVVDARRDAVAARPTLWRRRAGDREAFTVAFGLVGDPPGPVTIDLAAEAGVALVGSDDFTAGLARTLLVEAATLHGPADLEVAIATGPDRLGRWDWAKWLPHLRPGDAPRFIRNDTQLHEWATQLQARSRETAGRLSPGPLAVLVADDPLFWTGRESTLLELLASHPIGLRLIALAPDELDAPAACSTIVEECGDGTARLRIPDRTVDVSGILPALTEPSIATDVARHLAPLDDTERPRERFPGNEPGPATLAELLGPIPTAIDAVIDRWQRGAPALPEHHDVPLGTSGGDPVTVGVGPGRNVLVTGTPVEMAADLATGIVAALAARLPPDVFSIAHVATGAGAGMDGIDELPHLAGRFTDHGVGAARRLIVRLAHAVGTLDPARQRVAVVVDDARGTTTASPGLVEGLIELARSLPALHLIVTTDERPGGHPPSRTAFAVEIAVGGDHGGRRGSLRVDSERIHAPFAPYAPPGPGPAPGGLAIRPAVYGRPLTALERRLDLLARRADAGRGVELGGLAAVLVDAADHLGRAPLAPLVPRSLPPLHRAGTLFADWPGDAIPLGLVDLPERLETEPLWWQPGRGGTMLLLGSPRSGVDGALSTIVLGAAGRFSADDLHLHAIDPLNRRRTVVEQLPHAGVVTSPDQVDVVVELLTWLADETERRRDAGTTSLTDAPALLLLVHDLGRLRRTTAERADVSSLLATIASGADVNVNLVATAWRASEAGPLCESVPDRLVGALADEAEYERFGVIDPSTIEAQVGRCWTTAGERYAQLALPPDALDVDVAELQPEPASRRPPHRLATANGRSGR